MLGLEAELLHEAPERVVAALFADLVLDGHHPGPVLRLDLDRGDLEEPVDLRPKILLLQLVQLLGLLNRRHRLSPYLLFRGRIARFITRTLGEFRVDDLGFAPIGWHRLDGSKLIRPRLLIHLLPLLPNEVHVALHAGINEVVLLAYELPEDEDLLEDRLMHTRGGLPVSA